MPKTQAIKAKKKLEKYLFPLALSTRSKKIVLRPNKHSFICVRNLLSTT
jgi:hypothetical protein